VSKSRFLQGSLLILGALMVGACRIVTMGDASATQVAQTEVVGTAVAATLTAPVPHARIVEPSDGVISPPQSSVIVEYHDIPQDLYLWVVLRVPSVKPVWLVYPLLAEGVPEQAVGDGILATKAWIGGEQDSGKPFNIVVLLLDEEANGSFVEYAEKCIAEGDCGGILLPDTNVRILDFNTVIRE
jgi:hypothetical protein